MKSTGLTQRCHARAFDDRVAALGLCRADASPGARALARDDDRVIAGAARRAPSRLAGAAARPTLVSQSKEDET
ncbi:hypothetical protein [Pseudoroseicyclus aestuarii]|uniref:Uncharacterized protein n=1 Tax=Pseudoroseicyclus aestuarii TaxID=1795041 RepID=A0A318T7L9_9RHOB|nr:hypothetical protein [Pseudoroseicyclus aestuarii]PYE84388.1 hypothetical protein DFP88_102186 [Pseudoroseicyclus aestuarii]